MSDLISRQAAIDELNKLDVSDGVGISSIACSVQESAISAIQHLPSAQPDLDEVYAHAETEAEFRYHTEIVRCKDCKHWRQQTNYQGTPLSFGFCESDDMWLSLYGETYEVAHIDTDEDFYCGYAERREE